MSRMSGVTAISTWDPLSIPILEFEAFDITVPGAKLGDFVFASVSVDIVDMQLTVSVTDDDTVTCVLTNTTDSVVNLDEFTVRVKVIPYDAI